MIIRGLFGSHRAHAGTQRVASGIGDERMSTLPRGGDSGEARYPSDYVVAIGYDAVDITALNGIPVIGMDKGHHAVRGRVSFQRDAACASSQGVAYTRASAYDEHVVATRSSCPAQSVKNHAPQGHHGCTCSTGSSVTHSALADPQHRGHIRAVQCFIARSSSHHGKRHG